MNFLKYYYLGLRCQGPGTYLQFHFVLFAWRKSDFVSASSTTGPQNAGKWITKMCGGNEWDINCWGLSSSWWHCRFYLVRQRLSGWKERHNELSNAAQERKGTTCHSHSSAEDVLLRPYCKFSQFPKVSVETWNSYLWKTEETESRLT